MQLLKSDFSYNEFGINTRLVTEQDAKFIHSLRTNEEKTRFLHKVDDSIEKQIEWIRSYKKRENLGEEYYFVFEKNRTPIAVSRVYSIIDNHATTGSWISAPGTNPIDTLATAIILYDICFEVIQYEKVFFSVDKDNISAHRVNVALNSEVLEENDVERHYVLYSNSFKSVRNLLIKRWHIK